MGGSLEKLVAQLNAAEDTGHNRPQGHQPPGAECTLIPGAFAGDQLKQDFLTADKVAVANEIAARLHVTTADILALGALESTWGTSDFAVQGNNFFGLHYPTKGGGEPIPGHKVKMTSFGSFREAAAGFANVYGHIVQGKADAKELFSALQKSGKFGVHPDGRPVPHYISSGTETANGIAKGLTCKAESKLKVRL